MSPDPRPVLEDVAAKAGTAAFHDAIGSAPAAHMAVRRLQGEALRALAAGGQA